MTKLDHARPCLRDVDNLKRTLAQIEAWHASANHVPLKGEALAAKPMVAASSTKRIAGGTHAVGNKTSQKEIDAAVHAFACDLVLHVQSNREVSLCNKLCTTLKGARQEGMIEWFVTYASCRYDSKKKLLVFDRDGKNQVEECREKTFLEFKKPRGAGSFNLQEALQRLVATAESRLRKKPPNPGDQIDPLVLNAIKKLL